VSKRRAVFAGTAAVLAALAIGVGCRLLTQGMPSGQLVIVTWNVRGYPEKTAERREWFSKQLVKTKPNVLCVQEIANQDSVDTFLATEKGFTRCAFLDSSDGQDNAIYAATGLGMEDIPDPEDSSIQPRQRTSGTGASTR